MRSPKPLMDSLRCNSSPKERRKGSAGGGVAGVATSVHFERVDGRVRAFEGSQYPIRPNGREGLFFGYKGI